MEINEKSESRHKINIETSSNDYRYGINGNILGLLISKDKNYRPSQVASICNRSLFPDSIDNHNESLHAIGVSNDKGVLLKLGVLECLQASKVDIPIGEMTIKGIIFPGFHRGQDIYDKLDDVYDTIMKKRDKNNIYTIGAFFLILVTTINGFMDGNGRVSICLAKYIIDKFGDKKLSLAKLQENIDELAHYRKIALVFFMPKEILASALNRKTGEIDILASLKNNRQKIEKFLDEFSLRSIHIPDPRVGVLLPQSTPQLNYMPK